MHHVFVSYATTPDKQVADDVVKYLESIGIHCFYAPRDVLAGTGWRAQLEEGIKSSKVLVLILTAHSNTSKPVHKEIFIAAEVDVPILQFRIEELELHPDLKFELRGTHWLDAMEAPLDARIHELGEHLCRLLNHKSAAGVAPSAKVRPKAAPAIAAALTANQRLARLATTGNSLGMKFAPIPNVHNGLQVLGCIHPTRSKDFAAFIADKNRGYEMNDEKWRTYESMGWPVGRGKGERAEDSAHPAIWVSHDDAKAFTAWLTRHERSQGLIGPKDEYRLPTDHEWSLMVGIGDQEDSSATPVSKSCEITKVYPWGTDFPPKNKVGNYADETAKKAFGWDSIPGYDDGFVTTSPVMSFPANGSGFYDLGGNVWEWCEDWYNNDAKYRVFRGASWSNLDGLGLLSSFRNCLGPAGRECNVGFRCVLAVGSGG